MPKTATTSMNKNASIIFIATLVIDVILILFLAFTTPHFTLVRQYISELPIQSEFNRQILTAWWCIYSIPFICFGFALWTAMKQEKLNPIIGIFFALDGILTGILPALFTCEKSCIVSSFSSYIHLYSSAGGYLLELVLPIYLLILFKENVYWKQSINFLRTMFVALVLMACLSYLAEKNEVFHQYVGIIEFSSMLTSYCLFIGLALKLFAYKKS